MNCTKNLQKSLKLIVLIGKNCPNLQKLVKNGLFDVRIELFTLDQIYLSNNWYCGSFIYLLGRWLVVEQWIVPRTLKNITQIDGTNWQKLPKIPKIGEKCFFMRQLNCLSWIKSIKQVILWQFYMSSR